MNDFRWFCSQFSTDYPEILQALFSSDTATTLKILYSLNVSLFNILKVSLFDILRGMCPYVDLYKRSKVVSAWPINGVCKI